MSRTTGTTKVRRRVACARYSNYPDHELDEGAEMAMNRVQFRKGLSMSGFQMRYGTEAACEATYLDYNGLRNAPVPRPTAMMDAVAAATAVPLQRSITATAPFGASKYIAPATRR